MEYTEVHIPEQEAVYASHSMMQYHSIGVRSVFHYTMVHVVVVVVVVVTLFYFTRITGSRMPSH